MPRRDRNTARNTPERRRAVRISRAMGRMPWDLSEGDPSLTGGGTHYQGYRHGKDGARIPNRRYREAYDA